MAFGKFIVKCKIPIIIISILLCILSVIGMINTRVNFDMLTYLPKELETVKGQDILLEDFGKGAFSMIIVDGMDQFEVSKLKAEIEKVEHVDSVIWYDTIANIDIPMEILPDDIYDVFNSDKGTVMAAFFDSSTSSDDTIKTVQEIRKIASGRAFVAGMSAMVVDLKELCEKEEILYVVMAVVCALVVMMLLLDSYLVPFVLLATIGMAILQNMGTNFVFGEISYITKALSSVLQLAVTMDYSIFLWHSYNEHCSLEGDNKVAMAHAIKDTFAAVVGSSVTTIAGFVALCFMSFTLGFDIGIVMAKGVLIGVIASVTILPSIVLLLDKPLKATTHKVLIPNVEGLVKKIIKLAPLFIILFAIIIVPAYYGYSKSSDEVYYQIDKSLPSDLDFQIANKKLNEEYDMGTTQMILSSADVSQADVCDMIEEIEAVDGVKACLGVESLLGKTIPEEILPESIANLLKSENWRLMIVSSTYKVASDDVAAQMDKINKIIDKYDKNGMLIGEAACTQDMIELTAIDFRNVTIVSIVLVFLIILFVEKSLSLPIILVALIEVGIFINLGLPHYLGQTLPFITPICISTIQLGATVDYAILLTTRYKSERIGYGGQPSKDKKEAITVATTTSIPSILVSGCGLFAATMGVYFICDIDMISSMCLLLARGAIISMILVSVFLPAILMLCDGFIKKTTLGMRHL